MSTNQSNACLLSNDDKSGSGILYNGFFIVVATSSLLLDCLLLGVVGRRMSVHPDLYLISGFVISNMITSIGLFFSSIYRIWWWTAEPRCIHPSQCITDRFHVPMHMVGSDSLAFAMLLLSFERFLLFWRQKCHRIVFSPFCSTLWFILILLLSCLEVFFVYMDAVGQQDKLISSMCHRKDYTSPSYYNAYTFTKVAMAVVCLVFYFLSYVIHRISIQQNDSKTYLGTIRNSRRSAMLFNLLIIAFAIAFFHIAPLMLKPLSHSSPDIVKAAKIIHNIYLPLSTALCFVIHPFLLSTIQRLFARWFILKKCRSTSVVYIG
ncbi:hypothetical protein D918_04397 [Trichuris suis]|nr:hypothetical protein D918_04397 [Trichuris suis]